MNRWWLAIIHFFGPRSNVEKDLLLRWKVKTKTNEVLRQEFLDRYVPKVLELGFTFPSPVPYKDEESGHWLINDEDIDWEPLEAMKRTRARRPHGVSPRASRCTTTTAGCARRWPSRRSTARLTMEVYEVFRRTGTRSRSSTAATVIAPDSEMALVMAKECFLRRRRRRASLGRPSHRHPLVLKTSRCSRSLPTSRTASTSGYRDVVKKREKA